MKASDDIDSGDRPGDASLPTDAIPDGLGELATESTVAAQLAPTSSTMPSRASGDWTIPIAVGVMQMAGLTSIGAGAIHAGVAGLHAETPTLARLFVAVAVAQIVAGLLALVRGGRLAAAFAVAVNIGAVAAWSVIRLWGVSWIDGLETAEAAQFTDTACAALGAISVAAATVALVGRRAGVSAVRLGTPAFGVGVVALVAMLVGAGHVHGHDAEAAGQTHDEATTEEVATDGASGAGVAETAAHDHTEGETPAPAAGDASAEVAAVATGAGAATVDAATQWPRPWNPDTPMDFSNVDGVTPEQQLRATALIDRTLEELPEFADVDDVGDLGYTSIGDSGTGYEHYINYSLITDDKFLDPSAPESLVYRVNGEGRTLVSAMFISDRTSLDDPELVDYGGPLMQWHVHGDLCWAGGTDGPYVAGVVDADGNCPEGSVNTGGENPMVHVWIVPHECGPFAALEGVGAGQTAAADGNRTDQCTHEHDAASASGEVAADGDHAHEAGAGAAAVAGADVESGASVEALTGEQATVSGAPVPYDPELPIDLSGTPGVTAEQQAFAENLIANTLTDLPQWADPADAEAAGFRSIGDAATGHEHFVQWDWINDDVWLDPDFPESLVYEPQPDGSRRLVSAMYMLPDSYTLADVPDFGGALMQWHIHDNLCYDVSDPEAPRVGGLTDADGGCTAPLQKLGEAPMIHVWITPHPCGPFAALDGVGAGQVEAGEEHLCDEQHGSH